MQGKEMFLHYFGFLQFNYLNCNKYKNMSKK